MFRRFIALSSLALMWAIASNVITPATADAQAQAARMRFEAMDKNSDGAISRDEWQGSARSFQVHDWNGDGRLSGQEVAIGAQPNNNWEEADHRPNRFERYVSWTQAGFTNLDHNRDRRITTNEWHYDVETFRRVDRNRRRRARSGRISRRGRLGRRPRRQLRRPRLQQQRPRRAERVAR